MARTIGKKNINIIINLTKDIYAQGGEKQDVIDNLDAIMWDTWESADSEIRRIVHDEWFKIEATKSPWV